MIISLELPFPPSVNHYWRRVGNKTLISKDGRTFRLHVQDIVAARRLQIIPGHVWVDVVACPPDRRRRDLDNLCKSLLDALEHAGVYEGDHQIQSLRLKWGAVHKGGRALVTVGPSGSEPDTWGACT